MQCFLYAVETYYEDNGIPGWIVFFEVVCTLIFISDYVTATYYPNTSELSPRYILSGTLSLPNVTHSAGKV